VRNSFPVVALICTIDGCWALPATSEKVRVAAIAAATAVVRFIVTPRQLATFDKPYRHN
jgi:hypothetical protein